MRVRTHFGDLPVYQDLADFGAQRRAARLCVGARANRKDGTGEELGRAARRASERACRGGSRTQPGFDSRQRAS